MSDGVIGEQIAGGRWNPHWRWRVALLVVVVLLIGARYVAARNWKSRTLVSAGGGPPALVLTHTLHKSAIERWDWRDKRTETLAELESHSIAEGMLRAGDQVVWVVDGDLHMIDLKPPYARRQWKTPLVHDPSRPEAFRLVGASANRRFVAVQLDRLVAIREHAYQVGAAELAVIDLETGKVTSHKHWNSQMSAGLDPGKFESNRLPSTGRSIEPWQRSWRLTDHGDWELLSSATPGSSIANPEISKDESGKWRKLAPGETPRPGEWEERIQVRLRNQEHSLVRSVNEGELLLVHAGSAEVQRLAHEGTFDSLPTFSDDGKHIIAVDTSDNIHVFDAATGRLVASDMWGSFWRWYATGVSAALTCTVLGWFVLSWRQTELRWAIADLHACGMTAQATLFCFLGLRFHGTQDMLMEFGLGAMPAVTTAFGIAVGWYWIHGEAPIGIRLRRGFLSIGVIGIVPAATLMIFMSLSRAYVALVPPFAGLFAASVAVVLLAPLSLTGWRVSDHPVPSRGPKFGLASMMLIVSVAAVPMGFIKLGLLPSFGDPVLNAALFLMPAFTLGVFWPAIAMLNMARRWRIILGVVVAVFVLIAMAACLFLNSWYSAGFEWLALGFAVGTAMVVLGMAVLARRHGWRWRKAQASTGEVPSLEAAV